MITRWKFEAESFEQKTCFELDPEIPFLGDYAAAKQEAQKRIHRWEARHDDTICRVDLRPVIPKDDLSSCVK